MAVLAIDIGASSGRCILGERTANAMPRLREVHRFDSSAIKVGDRLHIDIDALQAGILMGIRKAAAIAHIDSIGIDTWGVDYGMLDENGKLIKPLHHYRDIRNASADVCKTAYGISGIQFMPFNTLYQLRHENLSSASRILLLPDLLAYLLTGKARTEYTNASTTNLLCADTHEFSPLLLHECGALREQFPPFISPGEAYGKLLPSIAASCALDYDVPVIAVGSHDTASAVASIGNPNDVCYISCGTWSLIGTLLPAPILTADAERENFTNELGVDMQIRFLKNVTGLWLIQEINRELKLGFDALRSMAENAPSAKILFDPDDAQLARPTSMTAAIRAKVGDLPDDQLLRCVYESLAAKYASVIKRLEQLTLKHFSEVIMLGGGSQDSFLRELTQLACSRRVIVGATEATALGNILVQLQSI